MKQFEDLRTNQEIYSIFYDRLIPCVIGRDKYKKHCVVTVPSVYTNEGDEAMTLLILANNYGVWSEISASSKEQGGLPKKKVGDLTSKQRFFVEGQGRGKSWSTEGRQYYNLMFELIRADRTTRGQAFDQYYLEKLQQEDNQCQSVRRDRRRSKARLATERIECHNNCDDDEDEQNNLNCALLQSNRLDADEVTNETEI
jgi:hypothetical protein